MHSSLPSAVSSVLEDDEAAEAAAMMQLEGADVQFFHDRSIVSWLVARGKAGAVRRQLSSRKEAELLSTFNTMADLHEEQPSSKRVTLSRSEIANCLALLGLDGRAEAAGAEDGSAEMDFDDFAKMMLAKQFETDLCPAGNERESTSSLLEQFPMMARAYDVRRTVTRSGAPPPVSASEGRPQRRGEARRKSMHRPLRRAAKEGMSSAEAAAALFGLSDVYEESSTERMRLGKASAHAAGAARAAEEEPASAFGKLSLAEDVERLHKGRRRVVGGPLPSSLAQLGTPAATAAARGARAGGAAGGLRASASAPALAGLAHHGRRAGLLAAAPALGGPLADASTASLHSAAEGADPLMPVHMARYTARSRVMPALEDADAGGGRRRPPVEPARIRHIVPDQSRGGQPAKEGVQARMQAWHDLRECTRDNGEVRRDTMRMGRSLRERQRIYLGHTNPMPVADDGIFEFYS
jgi:hypothetical protein